MTKVAVFSAGSWGTAFSVVLGDAGNDVMLWARRDEVVDAINTKRENSEYLPGIELPATVRATTDPAEAARLPGRWRAGVCSCASIQPRVRSRASGRWTPWSPANWMPSCPQACG